MKLRARTTAPAGQGNSPLAQCDKSRANPERTPESVLRTTLPGKVAAARPAQALYSSETYLKYAMVEPAARPTIRNVLTAANKQRPTKSDQVPAPKRGELAGVPGKNQGFRHDIPGFKKICGELDQKKLAPCEIKRLSQEHRLPFAASTIMDYVYGKRVTTKAGAVEWKIQPKAYLTLTEGNPLEVYDSMMLLPMSAQLVMISIIIRLARRRNGLTEEEIKQWARTQ
eukprot:1464778-Prymnesium_polylepis.1